MGVGDWPVGILCPGVPVKERTRKEKDVSPFLSTLSSAFSGSSSFAVQFLVLVSPIHLPGWNTSVHENGSVPVRTTIFAPRCRKYTATPTRPPSYFFFLFPNPIFLFLKQWQRSAQRRPRWTKIALRLRGSFDERKTTLHGRSSCGAWDVGWRRREFVRCI